MKISRAEFWAAAVSGDAIPSARCPEIAVAGRSNVGKSSLINRMVGRKSLARTSSTPGCTRGLIFYGLDDRLALVDLPGFGWAKRSKSERDTWKRLVEGYLETREVLLGVLLLIDVRRGPQEEEIKLAGYLDARELPYVWILTKCDKLKRAELHRRLAEIADELAPAAFLTTSSRTGAGIAELWKWLDRAIST
ncbi:MAG: YihA family ribosome biogenesis GTP-binding protein [Myxococcales bacterium]|jgi:GTP-binding protein|nr:MAG: YihA family ribosome biogenesis GTP-binding protein [Myxococcales bacterium]